MIEKWTVLVLGAGASHDYGFPTGRNLLRLILSDLDTAGWHKDTLHQLGFEDPEMTSFREELSSSGQGSVDEFVESRQEYLALGKAAIASRLVPQERPDMVTSRGERMQWYEYIRQQLGTRKDDVAATGLSVITFNYDRSLEFYLFSAFKSSYGMTDDDALELLETIPIIHVHGKLGEFSVAEQSKGRLYRQDRDIDAIKTAIDGIKVLHETDDSSPEFEEARKLLGEAHLICFLGFGYLSTNLNRLKVRAQAAKPDKRKPPHLFGSAFGLGDAQKRAVNAALHGNITLGGRGEGTLDFLQNHVVFE